MTIPFALASRRASNPASGTVKVEKPQSKQTDTLGAAKTPGLSIFCKPLR